MAKLQRSKDHKVIAGVCGGIADWLGWSPTMVRVLFVASFLFPGPQAVFYLLAWLVMPKQS
ncbi:PspC domain-containing protein [Corynebacterium lactis]|uniref:PspC domain-containing protein n=1 Tax=Corynebacterium lactis TaxID=1231000 RepID=UPI0009EAB3DE|nr:PspC domain-containing protein [Corynebacterium lactis]